MGSTAPEPQPLASFAPLRETTFVGVGPAHLAHDAGVEFEPKQADAHAFPRRTGHSVGIEGSKRLRTVVPFAWELLCALV